MFPNSTSIGLAPIIVITGAVPVLVLASEFVFITLTVLVAFPVLLLESVAE